MDIVLVLCMILYLMGLLSFCLIRSDLLLMLLSSEFIVVSLSLGLHVCLPLFGWESYFLMVFPSMAVCEGALELSILVLLMRSYVNDYMVSFNFLWQNYWMLF